MTVEPPVLGAAFDRRAALRLLALAGAGAALAACSSGSDPSGSAAPSTAAPSTTAAGSGGSTAPGNAVDCVLAPEMTEGPFYVDDDLVRSDITEGRPGAPLALTLIVADASTCAPIRGAAVDIWHADADGAYSGFAQGGSDSDSRFLRGTQVSGADGKVAFATVYPGWYQGRAVHIHVKVHAGGVTVHTGQLFFDDAFTDTVYANADPYSQRDERDVRNDDDSIFSDGGAQSTLSVQPHGSGYTAAMTLGVQA